MLDPSDFGLEQGAYFFLIFVAYLPTISHSYNTPSITTFSAYRLQNGQVARQEHRRH